jgi:RNA polymerase sigma-70 factor (sigma-E family)
MSTDDQTEFGVWAATARPRLRRTAYLLCGEWHLAEDLVQDTLVRLYAVWPRISRSAAPDAYARRTLINQYRSTLRRPWRREHPTDIVPDRPDPAASAAGPHDEREMLLAALAELGASQRAIVVLRYWEDMSVTEVADLLALSPGTVRSQSSRALLNLRNRLPALSSPTPGDER